MDTPLTIVLVEDHAALREVTSNVLQQSGYRVLAYSCVEDMDEQLESNNVDLFVLDLNLPGEDGISLARRMRKAHPKVGIIMVTARNAAEQMSEGFNSGADIYLVKPQAPETLLSAVESLVRRLRPSSPQLTLFAQKLKLSGPLAEVNIQEIEAKILIAFARSYEKKLETWQLAELIGNSNETASKSAIEVRITRLRKKLEECGAGSGSIKSLRTVGYQLCESISII